jgi:septal ring factor EnvC (AmiA/AmiB activator)
MEEAQQGYSERFFADINTRIRDLEEKQSLFKDRMRLVSESFVKERDKNFKEIAEMKKVVEKLRGENERMKEFLLKVGELVNKSARKEELMILQRQFDLFRDS